jgi:hypothetical protein
VITLGLVERLTKKTPTPSEHGKRKEEKEIDFFVQYFVLRNSHRDISQQNFRE